MNFPLSPATRPPHRPGEPTSAPRRTVRNRGVTLIELLIVLVILAGIAGIVAVNYSGDVTVPGADGEDRTAREIATLATMREVREALIGASTDDPGYRGDLGGLPSRLGGLIENIDGEDPFDPATARGWRGPYLLHEATDYGDFIEAGDGFPDNSDIAGIEDDPAILDAWRKPLVLQQPNTNDARLVSAGADRILETDPANPVDADRGDDVVLFLLTSDPNL